MTLSSLEKQAMLFQKSLVHHVLSLVWYILLLSSVAGSSTPVWLPAALAFHVTLMIWLVAPELATVTAALPLPAADGFSVIVTVALDSAFALVIEVGETVRAALLLLTDTLLVRL